MRAALLSHGKNLYPFYRQAVVGGIFSRKTKCVQDVVKEELEPPCPSYVSDEIYVLEFVPSVQSKQLKHVLFLDRHSCVDIIRNTTSTIHTTINIETTDTRSEQEDGAASKYTVMSAAAAAAARRRDATFAFRIANDLESRRLRQEADSTAEAAEETRHRREEADEGVEYLTIEAPTMTEFMKWVSIIGASLTRLQIDPLRALYRSVEGYSSLRVPSKSEEIEKIRASVVFMRHTVDRLERLGFPLGTKDLHGRSALFFASRAGNVEAVRYILERGSAQKEIEARIYRRGRSSTSIVSMKARDAVDVNCVTTRGVTPLSVATRHGFVDVIRILLRNGAHLFVGDGHFENSWQPLHVAARYSVHALRAMLNTPSLSASTSAAETSVLTAEHKRNAVCQCDRFGRSPASIAAEFGQLDALKELVQVSRVLPLVEKMDGREKKLHAIEKTSSSSMATTSTRRTLYVCGPDPLNERANALVRGLQSRWSSSSTSPLPFVVTGSFNIPSIRRLEVMETTCDHVLIYLDATTLTFPSACMGILNAVRAHRLGRKNLLVVVEANFRDGTTRTALQVALERAYAKSPPHSALGALKQWIERYSEYVIPLFEFETRNGKREHAHPGDTERVTSQEREVPIRAILQSVRRWTPGRRRRWGDEDDEVERKTAENNLGDAFPMSAFPTMAKATKESAATYLTMPRLAPRRLCEILLPKDAASIAICSAVHNGHLACARLLLREAGVSPDARLPSKLAPTTRATPLIKATARGSDALTGALLDAEEAEGGDRFVSTADAIFVAKKCADFDATSSFGWSACHYVALRGYSNLLEMLIEKGANLELRDARSKATPLAIASREGHVRVMDVLLKAGADVNARDVNGETPLFAAVRRNQLEAIRTLKRWGCDSNARNAHRENVLHVASSAESARGRDVDTTLHYETLKVVLEEVHASIQAQTVEGDTPLHRVVSHIEAEIVVRSKGEDTPSSTVARAAPVAQERVLRREVLLMELLRFGRQSMVTDDDTGNDYVWRSWLDEPCFYTKETALIKACRSPDGHELVRRLLEAGADVSLANASGRSPLHIASELGRAKCVERLLLLNDNVSAHTPNCAPANLHAIDADGRTPLHLAAAKGHCAVVKILISAVLQSTSRTTNAQDYSGATALWLACREGHADVVRILYSVGGASTEIPNKRGLYPIHIAARHFRVIVVKALAHGRASLTSLVERSRENCLHVAASAFTRSNTPARSAQLKTIACLLESLAESSEAVMRQRNRTGHTPSEIAALLCGKEAACMLRVSWGGAGRDYEPKRDAG
eukprot:g3734.t1